MALSVTDPFLLGKSGNSKTASSIVSPDTLKASWTCSLASIVPDTDGKAGGGGGGGMLLDIFKQECAAEEPMI